MWEEARGFVVSKFVKLCDEPIRRELSENNEPVIIIKKNVFYICKGFLGSEISWKPSCGTSVNEYPRKRKKGL